MYKLFKVVSSLFLIFSCTEDNLTSFEIDGGAGEDLFSQLSQEERKIVGNWGFTLREDVYEDGTIDTLYVSNTTYYYDLPQVDTVKFFSNKLIGAIHGCPDKDPPLLKGKLIKLVRAQSPGIFDVCFGTGNAGWLIENDTLIYYRSYLIDDILKYPIVKLNNDTLIFVYDFPMQSWNTIVKRRATFYKD